MYRKKINSVLVCRTLLASSCVVYEIRLQYFQFTVPLKDAFAESFYMYLGTNKSQEGHGHTLACM